MTDAEMWFTFIGIVAVSLILTMGHTLYKIWKRDQ